MCGATVRGLPTHTALPRKPSRQSGQCSPTDIVYCGVSDCTGRVQCHCLHCSDSRQLVAVQCAEPNLDRKLGKFGIKPELLHDASVPVVSKSGSWCTTPSRTLNAMLTVPANENKRDKDTKCCALPRSES
jgi:hypothetical protein